MFKPIWRDREVILPGNSIVIASRDNKILSFNKINNDFAPSYFGK